MFIKFALGNDWRGLVDAFLNGKVNFGFCLELIQTAVTELTKHTVIQESSMVNATNIA